MPAAATLEATSFEPVDPIDDPALSVLLSDSGVEVGLGYMVRVRVSWVG